MGGWNLSDSSTIIFFIVFPEIHFFLVSLLSILKKKNKLKIGELKQGK